MVTEADFIQAKFHSKNRPTYQEAKTMWPTMRAGDSKGSQYQYDHGNHDKPRATLTGAVKMWQTPAAQRSGAKEDGLLAELKTKDGEAPRPGERLYAPGRKHHSQVTLDRQVVLWPTARAGNPGSRKPGTGGRVLAEEVKKARLLPSPAERDHRTGMPGRIEDGHTCNLPERIADEHGRRGQLNPTWVEWLMGFPPGWTDLNASGTQSSHKSHTK